MADLEEGITSLKSDVCLSKHPKNLERGTHHVLLVDRTSFNSSASIRLAKSLSIDSELDWRDQSTIEPLQTTSRFLNPSPTKSNALNNAEWEFPSPARSEPRPKKSTEVTRSESMLMMDCYRSASVITTSLEPVADQDILSVSGTPIIPGILDSLPDVIESRRSLSPSPSRSSKCVDTQEKAYRLELGELTDNWKNDDSDSDSVCLERANFSLRHSVLSQSRRGSELLPPNEMWITGGPCPGIYVMKGRRHGRPRWLGAEAQVIWNQEAKAWLLISRKVKDMASALAVLCVNSNNPCVTSAHWRVGKAAKKGVSHNFFETYAFRIDNEMICTKYIGSGADETSASPIVRESTVVRIRRGIGVVRFVGPLEDQSGIFAGIELFTPTGLHNGTRNKVFYFEAKAKHGVFVHIPDAIKEVYGRLTDTISTFIDDLLFTTMDIVQVSEAAVERLVKIMLVLGDGESIFCRRRPNVLGIILFYELVMS